MRRELLIDLAHVIVLPLVFVPTAVDRASVDATPIVVVAEIAFLIGLISLDVWRRRPQLLVDQRFMAAMFILDCAIAATAMVVFESVDPLAWLGWLCIIPIQSARWPRFGAVVSWSVGALFITIDGVTTGSLMGSALITPQAVLFVGMLVLATQSLALSSARQREAEASRRFAAIVESLTESVLVIDAAERIQIANAAAVAMLGGEIKQIIGHALGDFVTVSAASEVADAEERSDDGGEAMLRGAEGTSIPVEMRRRPLLHGDPGFVITLRDIAEQKSRTSALEHRALHDPLTDLANRALLTQALGEAMARATAAETPLAVFLLDLDGFKEVNDTHGHVAGDQVLRMISERLRHQVRGDDLVARYGGDEFAIVQHGASREATLATAERLVTSLTDPIVVRDRRMSVGVSVGVAFHDARIDRGVADLLHRADAALYQAKDEGKACVVIHPGIDAAAIRSHHSARRR